MSQGGPPSGPASGPGVDVDVVPGVGDPACPHPARTGGVCDRCGHCEHDVVLNGACFYCGTTELDPLAMSPKPPAAVIAPERLVRKK